MFNSETYIKRRSSVKNLVGKGLLLFLGNNESPMNYADNTYHFRQDSTFLYFWGMDYAGLNGIIDTESGEEILFGNDLTVEDIVWMGTQPTLAERGQHYGIKRVLPTAELIKTIQKALDQKRQIHFLPPYRPDNQIFLSKLLGIPVEQQREKASIPFIKAVVDLRNHKSNEEIIEIEKAVDVSVDMHVAAMRMVRPGMSEAMLAAKVTEVALASGGNLSFPVIMTINGQTLHNHYHGNIIKEGDMVMCDCGAETALHYAGDLSSTFPASKKFSTQQKEIYNITLNAHEAALSTLGVGIPFREAHLTACKSIVDGLKLIGVMKGDTEEAVAAGAHAMFFPCGTGHMMGLDVHDMEDLGEVYVGYDGQAKSTQFGLKSLRLARPMELGFVATIEPGIYFIPELIDQWKSEGRFTDFIDYHKLQSFRNFGGIRNEEDIVITENGYRILGKKKPKTVDEVEAERQ